MTVGYRPWAPEEREHRRRYGWIYDLLFALGVAILLGMACANTYFWFVMMLAREK